MFTTSLCHTVEYGIFISLSPSLLNNFLCFPGKRAVFVPPTLSDDVEDRDLSTKGTLYCISIDHKGILGFSVHCMATM